MTEAAEMCGEVYSRPYGDRVLCTYIKDHLKQIHSWETLRVQDDADVAEEKERAARGIGHDDETPEDVQVLLDNITAGRADPYLEAILAVTHNRKRTLRGTRGFGHL
jgi:hypothetical protein